MIVKVLVAALLELDQDAQVHLYVNEDAGSLRALVGNGDDLYFQGDPAHEAGESYVYLTDWTGAYVNSEA